MHHCVYIKFQPPSLCKISGVSPYMTIMHGSAFANLSLQDCVSLCQIIVTGLCQPLLSYRHRTTSAFVKLSLQYCVSLCQNVVAPRHPLSNYRYATTGLPGAINKISSSTKLRYVSLYCNMPPQCYRYYPITQLQCP